MLRRIVVFIVENIKYLICQELLREKITAFKIRKK